ncbi:MAG: DNA-primase RepB domain-containing protein, partial [Planctomycetota bacterium]
MADGTDFTPDEVEVETERLRLFVEALLEPEQVYEIRPVPWAKPGSIWVTPDRIVDAVPGLMEWNRDGVNPYLSINPRVEKGATTGDGTLPGALVVADFDSGMPLAEVHAKLSAAGLPVPTAIVETSPEHWHCYWRLEERLPDLATHKRIQRALANLLGSCPNVCSHQQVMRLPGPFANVKPDRPARPRVRIIDCNPNRMYAVREFPIADAEPTYTVVPLEDLAVQIEAGSMGDATRALVEAGTLFTGKGRRASIFEAARDMHGRGWTLADATAVLVSVGQKLELEPDNLADVPRQVKNAFSTPASPGYAAAECASIDFATSGPTAVADDDEYDEALESIPLPEPPAMPPRPSLLLSHGVVGDFMARVELETEAHPVALASSLLVAIGNIIGRGPNFMVGRTPHYVNLYLAVVGNTGAGRKGTGGDIIRDCVRLADPHWAEFCQSPNLVSGEGVIDALRDRVTKLMAVKGGGPDEFEEVVLDPGILDKRLLITCPELVSAFRAGNRENSILAQTLREAWDGKGLKTMAKNCARTATDPHLSIIGHATRHELLKTVREADVFGGSMNRFL